jgi:hypothetical protein
MQANLNEEEIKKITKLTVNEKVDFDSKWQDHFWRKEVLN